MRFRLIYQGRLSASGNSSRVDEHWEIRNALHPQLTDLWQSHPILKSVRHRRYAPKDTGYFWPQRYNEADDVEPGPPPYEFVDVCEPIAVRGHQFVPLIRDTLGITCAINIIFMRKGAPGNIRSHSGDLDNRIKTLFDGLCMPNPNGPPFDAPADAPFYCLLQDDRLITDFSVQTERLFTKPGDHRNAVALVIEVAVRVMRHQNHNAPFLGD